MVENAAVLLCWGQGGGSDPSVAFFIIGGTRGGDSKGGSRINPKIHDWLFSCDWVLTGS